MGLDGDRELGWSGLITGALSDCVVAVKVFWVWGHVRYAVDLDGLEWVERFWADRRRPFGLYYGGEGFLG